MLIYHCRLTFHENLFYATREIGRLYETGRYLHNYALTYALGLAVAPYHHAIQRPAYRDQLTPLNQQGIYVTPARGTHIRYALNTFKYGNNNYHVKMSAASKNTPSLGRAKEVAVGSKFEFAILSENHELKLPHWIRMGIWRSKAQLNYEVAEAKIDAKKSSRASLPINPLDLEKSFDSFDLISMPPSSLLDHVQLSSRWWRGETTFGNVRLPQGMIYNIP